MTKPPAVAQAPPGPAPKPHAKGGTPTAHAAASGAVTIKNFAFGPASITVNAGDTVTWTNRDSAPHTATAKGGSFNTGTLAPGRSASHRFSTPGTFAYICAIHPNMHGTVVVAGSSGGSGSQNGGGGSQPAAGSGSGSSPATAAAPSPAAPAGATLPNTGLQLLVVALLGALFTAGGVALRRLADRP